MKNFFKGKKIGYYLMMASAVLSLAFGIVFFLTYKGAMANNASAHTPEIIGICAFLSFVVEVVALAVPEHKWVHLLALVAICFSLAKEIYLIPNLIADQINQVAFQGGSFPMNVFYLVMLFLIIILDIVACFLSVMSDERVVYSKPNVIRYGVSGTTLLAASLAALLVINAFQPKIQGGSTSSSASVFNVSAAFGSQVQAYDFNPLEVKFSKADNPFAAKTTSEIQTAVGSSKKRDGHNLVYQFEGFYAEGYQGNYSKTYAYLYLWDDGLYNGTQNNSNIYGYWYNVEDSGDACLSLIDNRGSDSDMICTKSSSKFYDWITDVKTSLNGGRSIKVNGFYYYPVIGMYIDTGDDDLKYDYGETIDTTGWTAMQVRNDLRFGPVFDPDVNVKWTVPSTSVSGTQSVKAVWGEYSAEVPVTIAPDTATYTLDASAATVKKNYRLVDRFDPTGIVVTRSNGSAEEKIDVDTLAYEMDLAGNKITITLPNNTVAEIAVSFDTSASANTITGQINGQDVSLVLTSFSAMNVTLGEKTCVAKIALSGKKGLATIGVVEKTSGDDEAFAILPKNIGISDNSGVLSITLNRYFTSTSKANSYSQDANTYFIFGPDSSYVIALWTFTYQGANTQEMKCEYTLSGALANGVSLTLTSLIEETNGQWQWCSNKSFTITECGVADLPFTPTLK